VSSSPLGDRRRTPEMFTAIAPRYDLLNRLLSGNIDRSWRARLVAEAGIPDGGSVLDVATGTGDVALEFARRTRAARIVGVDPSAGMLRVGRAKIHRAGFDGRVHLVRGDALRPPFFGDLFDAATIAFGLRNLPDFPAGVNVMARSLRPGGKMLVLEFSPPRRGVFLAAYRFYLRHVLPDAGRIVSGSREAYRYLAESIETFVNHDELAHMMQRAGLRTQPPIRLTGGIAYIHRGVCPGGADEHDAERTHVR